jgi:hypothetical protein
LKNRGIKKTKIPENANSIKKAVKIVVKAFCNTNPPIRNNRSVNIANPKENRFFVRIKSAIASEMESTKSAEPKSIKNVKLNEENK